jgi:hypothetical protein
MAAVSDDSYYVHGCSEREKRRPRRCRTSIGSVLMRPRLARQAGVGLILLLALSCGGAPGEIPSPLRTAGAVASVPRAELERGRQVTLEGTVTLLDSRLGLFVVQDATGGLPVSVVAGPANLARGERVKVRGFTGYEAFAPLLVKGVVERVEGGAIPPPKAAAAARLMRGELDYQLVEVRATITRDRGSEVMRFDVDAELPGNQRINIVGTVGVTFPWPLHLPSEVTVKGVPITTRAPSGEVLAVRLFVGSADDLELESPSGVYSNRRGDAGPAGVATGEGATPSARGAELPTLTTAFAAKSLANDDAARGYPVLLRGVLTSFYPDGVNFFIQDETAAVFVLPLSARPAVAPGDLVEVAGRVGRGSWAPFVIAREVRRIGRGRFPDPVRPDLHEPLSGRDENAWAELEGTVLAAQAGTRGEPSCRSSRVRLGCWSTCSRCARPCACASW